MNAVTDILRRDAVLGTLSDPAIRQSIFEKVRRHDGAFLIEGDFFNLSHLNGALGRANGNAFMRLMTGIVQDSLEDINPDSLFISRAGRGDEISFMISGVSEDDLRGAVVQAEEKIAQFAEEAGISELKHRKYVDKAGAGMKLGFAVLDQDSEYEQVASALQMQIAEAKEQEPAFEGNVLLPNAYHNQDAENRFASALDSEQWATYRTKDIAVPDDLMSDFTSSQSPTDAAIIKRRELLGSDLRSLDIEGQDFSYARFDISNLGGLNKILGEEAANNIKDQITAVVVEETLEQFENAQFYDVGGGNIDVVLPTQNTDEIAFIKNTIHQRLYEEVLSKPCSEFIVDVDKFVQEFEDMPVGHLPHTDDQFRGVGLVMADVPVNDTHNLAALAERVDCTTAVLKIHNVAFVENAGEERVRAHHIGMDSADILENREPSVDNALPWAKSLQATLSPEKTIAIMLKPVGLVTQQLFGVDLSEPMQRHNAMKHLMQSKAQEVEGDDAQRAVEGAVQEEIITHAGSIEEFDKWMSEAHADFDTGHFNLLDRPNLHMWLDNSLMSMTLSERWGFVSSDVKDLVLSGQLTARILDNIVNGVPHQPSDSIGFVANAIRTGFEGEENLTVKITQYGKEAADMMAHLNNVRGDNDGLSDDTYAAFSTITKMSAAHVADKALATNEPAIASAFRDVPNHQALADQKDVADPITTIEAKLSEVKSWVSETDKIDDINREKILSKFEGLQLVAESIRADKLALDRSRVSNPSRPAATA